MNSWPPTLVDWGVLTPQLANGAPVCTTHGLVAAEQAPIGIPICPYCRQAVLITHRDQRGKLRGFIGPAPSRCGRGHPLIGGQMTVGWIPCKCPAAWPGPGGHRTWSCTRCVESGRLPAQARDCWPPACSALGP
jgi:hypothetical protein